uniref:Uncharacterized protein n=1 Tax=Neospora caninum (strain Liverpool) TaxID=572307 RepID=A0A0F7UBF9_NEOCL|nr:TPA: hypothetical protein BN1204_015770 [Neospora caninum Liverpool]
MCLSPFLSCPGCLRVILLGVFDQPVVAMPPSVEDRSRSSASAFAREGGAEERGRAQRTTEECRREDEKRGEGEAGKGPETEDSCSKPALPLFDADGDLLLIRKTASGECRRNQAERKRNVRAKFTEKNAESTVQERETARQCSLSACTGEGETGREGQEPRAARGEAGENATEESEREEGDHEERKAEFRQDRDEAENCYGEERQESDRQVLTNVEDIATLSCGRPGTQRPRCEMEFLSRPAFLSPSSPSASPSRPSASFPACRPPSMSRSIFSPCSPQLISQPFAVCHCASPTTVAVAGRQLWSGGLLLVNFLFEFLLSLVSSSSSGLALAVRASEPSERLPRRAEATLPSLPASQVPPAPEPVSVLSKKRVQRRHAQKATEGETDAGNPSGRKVGEDRGRDRETEEGKEGDEGGEGEDPVERRISLTVLELGCGVGLLGGGLPSLLEAVDCLSFAGKHRQTFRENTDGDKRRLDCAPFSSPFVSSSLPSSRPPAHFSSGTSGAPLFLRPPCSSAAWSSSLPSSSFPDSSCPSPPSSPSFPRSSSIFSPQVASSASSSLSQSSPLSTYFSPPSGRAFCSSSLSPLSVEPGSAYPSSSSALLLRAARPRTRLLEAEALPERSEKEERLGHRVRARGLGTVKLFLTDADEGALSLAASTVWMNGGDLACKEREDEQGLGEAVDAGKTREGAEEGDDEDAGEEGDGDGKRGVRETAFSFQGPRRKRARFPGRLRQAIPSAIPSEADCAHTGADLSSCSGFPGFSFSFGSSEEKRRVNVAVCKLVWGSGQVSLGFPERLQERRMATRETTKILLCGGTHVAGERQASQPTEAKEEWHKQPKRGLQEQRQGQADTRDHPATGKSLHAEKENDLPREPSVEEKHLLILAADALYDYNSCDAFAVQAASLLQQHARVRNESVLGSSRAACSLFRSPIKSSSRSSSRESGGKRNQAAFPSVRGRRCGVEKRPGEHPGVEWRAETRGQNTGFEEAKCVLCHTRRVGISCPTSTVPVDVFAEYFRERFVRNVTIAGEVPEGEGDEEGGAEAGQEDRGGCEKKKETECGGCEGDTRREMETKGGETPSESDRSPREKVEGEGRAGAFTETREQPKGPKIGEQNDTVDRNRRIESEEPSHVRKRKVRPTGQAAGSSDGSAKNLIEEAAADLGPPPWFDLVLHQRPPIRVMPLASVLLSRGDVRTDMGQPCSHTKSSSALEDCGLSRAPKGRKGGGRKAEPQKGVKAERQTGRQICRGARQEGEEGRCFNERKCRHERKQDREGDERNHAVSAGLTTTRVEGTREEERHRFLDRVTRRHCEAAVDRSQLHEFVLGNTPAPDVSVEIQRDITRDVGRERIDETLGRRVASDLGQFLHGKEFMRSGIDRALLPLLPHRLQELLGSQWQRMSRSDSGQAETEGQRREDLNCGATRCRVSMEPSTEHAALFLGKDKDKTSMSGLSLKEVRCSENEDGTEQSSRVTTNEEIFFDARTRSLQFSTVDGSPSDATRVNPFSPRSYDGSGGSPGTSSVSYFQRHLSNSVGRSPDSVKPPASCGSTSWLIETLKMTEVWELRLCEGVRRRRGKAAG